jgi:hypothetical protein
LAWFCRCFLLIRSLGGTACHAEGRGFESLQPLSEKAQQWWGFLSGERESVAPSLADLEAIWSITSNEGPADPRLTFEQAAEKWWSARVENMRPATQATYRSALKHVGRTRLSDITAGDVAALVAEQKRAGCKGWTIKGHLTTLSGIFRYAGRHLGFTARTR